MSSQQDEHLQQRLKTWREEQYRVASQVIIKSDSSTSLVEHERFSCIPLLDSSSSPLVGGVDVSFPSCDEDPAVAVYTVLDSSQTVVYHDTEYFDLTLPYVSSYLSFREIDPLVRLVKKQVSLEASKTPRYILVDGNGILHERRAGIACFLGVYTNIPTIGVAKSLYCQGGLDKSLVHRGIDASLAAIVKELEQNIEWKSAIQNKGKQVVLVDTQPICASASFEQDTVEIDREECIKKLSQYCRGLAVKLQDSDGNILAAALVGHGGAVAGGKQRQGTKIPIFISIGHDVSLQEAVRLCATLSLARIPEPVRQADLSGRELLRQEEKSNNR